MGKRSLFSILVRAFIILWLEIILITAANSSITCGYSKKLQENGECVQLENLDVIRAVHFLAEPQIATCTKITNSQDISICEDNLPAECVVWSVIATEYCDNMGSLEFEKFWSKRCSVTIFHFHPRFRGNICSINKIEDHPKIEFVRLDMWGRRCFSCFYHYLNAHPTLHRPDILKIQRKGGLEKDEYEGVQFSILSDLFLHNREFTQSIPQIVLTVPLTPATLIDYVGREAEHAWNMWATQQLFRPYASISTKQEIGQHKKRPFQFDFFLDQARVSTDYSYYHHTLLLSNGEEERKSLDRKYQNWLPNRAKAQQGQVPGYCQIPSSKEDKKMQEWIKRELLNRCHPTQLAVPCDHSRQYDAIIPCRQELMNDLAEDYAITKGWCNFRDSTAAIIPLNKVDSAAYSAFRKPSVNRHKEGVRLAFFFTVYTDFSFVKRLFNHLYSSTHYYLYHVDPSGASLEFIGQMRKFASEYENVFISMDVPIVYGASTATIVLTRAMAWFHRYATGWDYFVPLTGSDYPLVPLKRIEKIFSCQHPPMPFVMAWTPGTSTHLFRLQTTHPIFQKNPYLAASIKAVTDERGKELGAVPMEYRSGNFGPPLFCNNQSSFYHLHNRFNKSGLVFDTQWLFPKDIFPRRGKAISQERPDYATPSSDGIWRVWKKSDPATTGAYDKDTIAYIVASEEGRKYWHFFKHMLLGSEEHYYVSLLYNWERTRSFVQTLSSEIVWNTWELGLWEKSAGFQTHTHFLTTKEWDIIKGFSMRGMMFARKFSNKKTEELLDRIDREILLNETTDAGFYWPGFFHTDISTPGPSWKKSIHRNFTVKGSVYKVRPEVRDELYETYARENLNADLYGKCPTLQALNIRKKRKTVD